MSIEHRPRLPRRVFFPHSKPAFRLECIVRPAPSLEIVCDAEYYLVIERINDVSDLTLCTEERERLEQIVGQYETRRKR